MEEKSSRIDFEKSDNILQGLSVRIPVFHEPSTVI